MLHLIDGDVLAHRMAHASTDRVDVGDGTILMSYDTHLMRAQAHSLLHFWTDGQPYVVYLSGNRKKRFRNQILPTYKENRKHVEVAVALGAAVKMLADEFGATSEELLEGDDLLGLASTADSVIVSSDKDFFQVPGTFKRLRQDGGDELHTLSLDEADYFHAVQILTGDRVDGYFGCPGVGPVNAKRLLDGQQKFEWWAVICAAYEKKGLTEADALVQAQVSRILRPGEFNFETKEITLWNPNNWN